MPEGSEAPSGPARLAGLAGEIRAYWDRERVPAALGGGTPDGPVFRFTEGPPTANGRPHVGHLIARILKDVALRYHRMRGYRIVSSMAGWDCHGLPVELEIEKRLGLRSKKEIESYGVARFSDACRASVLEVANVWIEMSRRLGYWLDYDHAYRTMDARFIESVWWSLRQLFDRGLLEKGHYVVPYCPRCETPLASHEVAQGYKEATDPSVTIRVRLDGGPAGVPEYLLVWTTTPWTLPANLLIAARADLAYVAVDAPDGGRLWLAEAARPRYVAEASGEIRDRRPGSAFEGRGYASPFPFAGPGPRRYRVVLDDMVTAGEGTGFVHIAPSFGPEDQRVGAREGVGLYDPLDGRGVFGPSVPPVAGKGFKAADPILLQALAERGDVVQAATVRHTYPFCWRCGTPLLYRALDSWFVRTSRFNAPLVRNNASIEWHPSHLREGRFGNFLTEAKDWALSRNRFWGTPLPIWLCPEGHATCIGSFAELAERAGRPLPSGFDPHRAGVDPIVFPCPRCGAPSHREPYTIDGWYDSGSAPFAQYHYPFEPGPFDPSAPLDFVAEGLDQTRGWFYTMHVLATSLWDRPAFRVAVVNGLTLDESGQKMSKSKGNVLDPMAILERHGGDPVRWAFLTIDYTEPSRVGDAMFQRAAGRTLATLLNVLAFYEGNAPTGGFAPRVPSAGGSPLDRWILSRLDGTIAETTRQLDRAEYRRAAAALETFVDDLSLWYLRRSRPRFWAEEGGADQSHAVATLALTLATVARLMAPFAPFLAEELHLRLTGAAGAPRASDSVHGTRWPGPLGLRDEALETAMARIREEAEIGRELRHRAQIRSRTPLEVLVLEGEPSELDGILAEELNVREVRRSPRIDPADVPEPGWVLRAGADGGVRAALPRTVPPELVREGWLREGLRRLQMFRKELGLSYTARLALAVTASGPLFEALAGSKERLRSELLLDRLDLVEGPGTDVPDGRSWTIDGEHLVARRLGP